MFFSLNIGYDWVMKRWQFRAPCLGVFPKCHFINHRMDLPISRFLPDYIDTEHIIEITPGPAYIYHDEHPPSEMSTLIRNAKEMFWHWHVTCVWTLWPGEEHRDGEGAGRGKIVMNECHQDDAETRPDPAQAASALKKLEWSNECYYHSIITSKRNAYAFQF